MVSRTTDVPPLMLYYAYENNQESQSASQSAGDDGQRGTHRETKEG